MEHEVEEKGRGACDDYKNIDFDMKIKLKI